jgi:hypothetical protein
MKRLLTTCAKTLLLAGASLPAWAHVGATSAPHLHAGDGWGVLVVAALTAVAVWLDRRGR